MIVHAEMHLTGISSTRTEEDEIAESGLRRLNNHVRVILRAYGGNWTHTAIREVEWEFNRV